VVDPVFNGFPEKHSSFEVRLSDLRVPVGKYGERAWRWAWTAMEI
jgi:hypothetical protein